MPDEFYNGNNLLNMLDINNDLPEVYMCVGNRTAGKTFFFKEYILNEALCKNKLFCILCRKKPEVQGICDAFFTDIAQHYKINDHMTSKSFNGGLYHELYFNNLKVGYATYLNGSEAIKKISPLFYQVENMYFDEAISETYDYIEKEITKLISLHISIARGGKSGKRVRRVPLILNGNSSTAINPYFKAFHVDINKINKNTKFYKGDGYVIQFERNKKAASELKESAFARAFSKSTYLQGSIDNTMFMDTQAFIFKKMPPKTKYILSIMGKEIFIGVYMSPDGLIYFSRNCNVNFKFKCTLDKGYQTPEIPHITATIFYQRIRDFTLKGKTLFSDIELRKIVLDGIGQSML